MTQVNDRRKGKTTIAQARIWPEKIGLTLTPACFAGASYCSNEDCPIARACRALGYAAAVTPVGVKFYQTTPYEGPILAEYHIPPQLDKQVRNLVFSGQWRLPQKTGAVTRGTLTRIPPVRKTKRFSWGQL